MPASPRRPASLPYLPPTRALRLLRCTLFSLPRGAVLSHSGPPLALLGRLVVVDGSFVELSGGRRRGGRGEHAGDAGAARTSGDFRCRACGGESHPLAPTSHPELRMASVSLVPCCLVLRSRISVRSACTTRPMPRLSRAVIPSRACAASSAAIAAPCAARRSTPFCESIAHEDDAGWYGQIHAHVMMVHASAHRIQVA